MEKSAKIFFNIILISVMVLSWRIAFAQGKVELKCATFAIGDVWVLDFKKRLADLSAGRVVLNNYPGGQLGTADQVLHQVIPGSIDIYLSGTEISTLEDKIKILDLPFLIRDQEHAKAVTFGPVGDEIVAQVPKKGVRILSFLDGGFRNITNNKRPIVSPKDLKDLKIRTPSHALRVETFRAFGAIPAPMNVEELYSALSQGVVDGQENPISIIERYKFYEVQKYLSKSAHVYSTYAIVINESKWQKLEPDVRDIVRRAARETGRWTFTYTQEKENESISRFEKAGMKVTEVDYKEFFQAVQPVWQKYDASYGTLIGQITNAK